MKCKKREWRDNEVGKGSKQDCNWVLDKEWAPKKKIYTKNEENMGWNRGFFCNWAKISTSN